MESTLLQDATRARVLVFHLGRCHPDSYRGGMTGNGRVFFTCHSTLCVESTLLQDAARAPHTALPLGRSCTLYGITVGGRGKHGRPGRRSSFLHSHSTPITIGVESAKPEGNAKNHAYYLAIGQILHYVQDNGKRAGDLYR